MDPHPWRHVLRIGREQGGPIAVRQAVAVGIPRSTFDDRVRREGWARPFPAVAVAPGVVIDATVRVRAAALWLGHPAVVTGWSALLLRGVVDDPPARVHLVVPPERRRPERSDVNVIRSRTLLPTDHEMLGGVAVARVPRAMLDAARGLGRERLRGWLIDGRQRGLLDVGEVVARAMVAPSVAGRGRLLAACRDVDASGADSVLAGEVEARLRAAGFEFDVPPRTVPVTGRVLHPDLTIRGLPVAIEVDGFGAHASQRGLDLDQRKHNAYALAGWIVLRIGWARLTRDWDGFVAELRSAVARAEAAGHADQA